MVTCPGTVIVVVKVVVEASKVTVVNCPATVVVVIIPGKVVVIISTEVVPGKVIVIGAVTVVPGTESLSQ